VVRGVYSPETAISEYHRLVEARIEASAALPADAGADTPSVQAVAMFSNGSTPTHLVHRGDEATVLVTMANPGRVPVNLGVAIYRSDGLYCFGTNTFISKTPPPPADHVAVEVHFSKVDLLKGSYNFLVGIFGESVTTVYEMKDHAYEFRVDQRDNYDGAVYLPHSWRVRARD
jgi:hypothetical protein